MKPMLHCFWTGSSFPYNLRSFIKLWVRHLRASNSDFEMVLWVTDDTLAVMKNYLETGVGNRFDKGSWRKCIVGCDVLFKRVRLNFCDFYIARCEDQLKRYPADLKTMFTVLSKGKRYTTVSNIGRLIAVNACGGIYTDVDYLLPILDTDFPQDMRILLESFEHCSKLEFYLPTIRLGKSCLIENQCVVLDCKNIGCLTPLIRKITKDLMNCFALICVETGDHKSFLENEVTKELNQSLFMDGLFRDLLEAYKRRDITKFDEVNEELYRDQYLSDYYMARTGTHMRKNVKPMLRAGDRHEGYQVTSGTTYASVVNFFSDNLTPNLYEYIDRYWSSFLVFFNKEGIDSQFLFDDKREGRKRGMYSWANPGYSRLRSLEGAAKIIERRYIEQKGLIAKSLMINLMKAVEAQCTSFIEEGRLRVFDRIEAKLYKLSRNYLTPIDMKDYLKEFLAICFLEISIMPSKVGLKTTEIINQSQYVELRNIIDPEKELLTYEDLRAFSSYYTDRLKK